jgi:hypothetical protein
MGTLELIVAALRRFLRQDLAAVDLMFVTSRAVARDTVLANVHPAETTQLGPSLEVVNVAGDSAVGRDRIQSAPNL